MYIVSELYKFYAFTAVEKHNEYQNKQSSKFLKGTEKKMTEFWSELYELRWPALFASSTAQHLSPLFFDQSGAERF